VAAEVEGAHHTQGLNAVDDAVRQNEVSIVGDVVIRIPVLGLRLDPETFMAQLARALQAAAGRRGRPLAAGATTGEAATGEAATGEAAAGEAATGEAATGEAATGEAATGEAATGG
jgi:hypothetical protein